MEYRARRGHGLMTAACFHNTEADVNIILMTMSPLFHKIIYSSFNVRFFANYIIFCIY
jgi:hypothetical protein